MPRRANNISLLRRLIFSPWSLDLGTEGPLVPTGSCGGHSAAWCCISHISKGTSVHCSCIPVEAAPTGAVVGSDCHAAGTGIALWVPRSYPHLRLLFIAVARYLPRQSGELSSSSTSARRITSGARVLIREAGERDDQESRLRGSGE